MRSPWKGPLAACAAGLALAALAATPARAQWSTNPAVNNAICTATGDQAEPACVSDGANGAFIAWADRRGGTWDVYLQRITSAGVIAAGWPANGLAIATGVGDQADLAAVADGAGGVVLVWQDRRSGTPDLYAQRVRSTATSYPGWPANGLALCTSTGVQGPPSVCTDGAGGAIVGWSDQRAGAANPDVYAVRVLGSGAIAGGWPANGLALCTSPDVQQLPVIAADGSGGAIVAWEDDRLGTVAGWDIYALRVTGAGLRATGWPANGLAVCNAAGVQSTPAIISDGAGGCLVAWEDFRGGARCNAYLQRITGAGAVAGGWPANGRALASAAGDQIAIALHADTRGGALAAWEDYRAGLDADIYAMRVTSAGVNRAGWPTAGFPVCTATGAQQSPVIDSDGGRGAVIAWEDYRAGLATPDVYAQRVTSRGAIGQFWPTNGAVVSSAAGAQLFPSLVTDAGGNAIVAWRDYRGGATSDVYAQLVQVDGLLALAAAVNVAVAPAMAADGATALVQLSWQASAYDTLPAGGSLIARYDVMRRGEWVPTAARPMGATPDEAPADEPGGGPASWVRIASVPATGQPSYQVAVDPGGGSAIGPFTFRVDAVSALGDTLIWPSDEVTSGDALAAFPPAGVGLPGALAPTLAPIAPSPARDGAQVRFTLGAPGAVRLIVYDAGGRAVRVLRAGEAPAGAQVARWDGRDGAGRPAPSGVYWVRLEAAGRAWARRFALVR